MKDATGPQMEKVYEGGRVRRVVVGGAFDRSVTVSVLIGGQALGPMAPAEFHGMVQELCDVRERVMEDARRMERAREQMAQTARNSSAPPQGIRP